MNYFAISTVRLNCVICIKMSKICLHVFSLHTDFPISHHAIGLFNYSLVLFSTVSVSGNLSTPICGPMKTKCVGDSQRKFILTVLQTYGCNGDG